MYYRFKNIERRKRWDLLVKVTEQILSDSSVEKDITSNRLIELIDTGFVAPSFFITRKHGWKLISAIEGSFYQDELCRRPIEMQMAIDLYKVFREVYLEKSPIKMSECVDLAINHDAPSFYLKKSEATSLLNLLR